MHFGPARIPDRPGHDGIHRSLGADAQPKAVAVGVSKVPAFVGDLQPPRTKRRVPVAGSGEDTLLEGISLRIRAVGRSPDREPFPGSSAPGPADIAADPLSQAPARRSTGRLAPVFCGTTKRETDHDIRSGSHHGLRPASGRIRPGILSAARWTLAGRSPASRLRGNTKKPADEGGLWMQWKRSVGLPDRDHGGPLGP